MVILMVSRCHATVIDPQSSSIASSLTSPGRDPLTVSRPPRWTTLLLHNAARTMGAVCLDGSPPGYHYQPGTGVGAQTWILYFQGGAMMFGMEWNVQGSGSNLTKSILRRMLLGSFAFVKACNSPVPSTWSVVQSTRRRGAVGLHLCVVCCVLHYTQHYTTTIASLAPTSMRTCHGPLVLFPPRPTRQHKHTPASCCNILWWCVVWVWAVLDCVGLC